MEKYVNKPTAKKLMYGGGALLLLGNIIIFITLFSIYDKAGQALDDSPTVSLNTEQVVIDIARIMSTIGLIILVSGVIVFLIARSKRKE